MTEARRFQFRLSSALAAVFVASGLLYLNLTPVVNKGYHARGWPEPAVKSILDFSGADVSGAAPPHYSRHEVHWVFLALNLIHFSFIMLSIFTAAELFTNRRSPRSDSTRRYLLFWIILYGVVLITYRIWGSGFGFRLVLTNSVLGFLAAWRSRQIRDFKKMADGP